jgi:hypothetical protein
MAIYNKKLSQVSMRGASQNMSLLHLRLDYNLCSGLLQKMVAAHNDQSGPLQKMDGRNGQSEGGHGEDQAQSIQDQVPIREKVSSVEIVTEKFIML